jgi:hypothetical protein
VYSLDFSDLRLLADKLVVARLNLLLLNRVIVEVEVALKIRSGCENFARRRIIKLTSLHLMQLLWP